MNDQEGTTQAESPSESLSFNSDTLPVIKETQAPEFRVIFCEGCEGGSTPSGLITMGVYSQYLGRPEKKLVVADEEAGSLREEPADRNAPIVIVREFQAQMLFNLETARAIHSWLGASIQSMENPG